MVQAVGRIRGAYGRRGFHAEKVKGLSSICNGHLYKLLDKSCTLSVLWFLGSNEKDIHFYFLVFVSKQKIFF